MTLRTITANFNTLEGLDSPVEADQHFYAGGTDLIPLARAGVLTGLRLLDIKDSGLTSSIEQTPGGWEIGALATLADLADHADLNVQYPAIGQAVRQSATGQIRNRATVGGNLLQRPRCSYFRNSDIDCWMKGGSSCPAIEGRNEFLGLTGGTCVAVQPSDLASVLVALDASVTVRSPGDSAGTRSIPVADFLVTPTDQNRRLHRLGDGEMITSIGIPAAVGRSIYLKAMNRAVWQFALVGVAAVVSFDDASTVTEASIVASGISSTPFRLDAVAEELVGGPLDRPAVAAAARIADAGLEPLSENGYKTILLRGLVTRALQSLATGG